MTLITPKGHSAETGYHAAGHSLGGMSEMGVVRNLKGVFSAQAAYPSVEPEPDSLAGLQPRRFLRVPTHAVLGVVEDRRHSPRACLNLPMRLTSIAGVEEETPVTLVTKNISSTGIYFLAPRIIEPGSPIELEVALVERPLGRGSVRMKTLAHVVRAEACEVPGWNGFAATFDDIDFQRDDVMPPRYRRY